jgi:nicotinate-nucleotide--dimethylbenzimidazole phosphoribosyltransferase
MTPDLPHRPLPHASEEHLERARAHQSILTKPPGSLGVLEDVAVFMAGFQGSARPAARPASALLFVADHPVTQHGVSPYPSSVTRAMVQNIAAGGAAASILARQHQIPLHVCDVGVDGGAELPPAEITSGVTFHRMDPPVAAGDIRYADALSPDAFAQCLAYGKGRVRSQCSGDRLVIFGEMGIGNTTAAAAVAALILRCEPPDSLVGAGTGAQGLVLASKRAVVRDCIFRLPANLSPLEILRCAGGREMAAIYGAMREALAERRIVLVDGFIVSAVAAVLMAEEPGARAGLLFSHESHEQGHRTILKHLGASPLLTLGLRLGEASGALCAYPLVESACELHLRMATFQSASIPEKER